MWRSTEVGAERKKCWSTQDIAHACGEALGSEQEMLNDRSTWDIATRCEEALGSEQERIECRSTEDMAHSCGEALQ